MAICFCRTASSKLVVVKLVVSFHAADFRSDAFCDGLLCLYFRQHTSAYVSIRQHTSGYVSLTLVRMNRCDGLLLLSYGPLAAYHRMLTYAAYVSVC